MSPRDNCGGSASGTLKVARFKNAILALVLSALPLSTPAFADKAMLVFDASGSMNAQINGKTKLQIAREVVNGLVQEWPQATELGMIAYGHREKDNCGDIQTLVKPAADSWPAIKAAVGDVEAKGKTPITQAVRAAAKELKSEEGKATVILVSDGLETCNADPCAAAAELEKSGVDFTVHVVGFGTTNEENRQLQCIADKTGGRFLGAKDASELKTAMTKTVELVAKPEPPKQNVVKVGANIGKLRISNTKETQRLLDSDGKEPISGYIHPGQVYDLRPGRYSMKSHSTGIVTVESFEIRGGHETVLNFLNYVGRLKIINTKETQRLLDNDGNDPISGYIYPEQVYDLRPGRYSMKSHGTGIATVENFEIRGGQEIVLNFQDYVGRLKVINTKETQSLLDHDGNDPISGYIYPGQVYDLRPGRYSMKSHATGVVTVDSFEIRANDETVLDFGN